MATPGLLEGALKKALSGCKSAAAWMITQLERNDVATAGTAEASKSLVLGTNKNIDTLVIADGGLKLGSGAGTAVTSTAAELNILDGATLDVGELNILDGVLATAAEINRATDVSTRIVNVTDGPVAITVATHEGKIVTIDKADGITITLPDATGSGAVFKFFIGTTVTSNTAVIKVANASDTMVGLAVVAQDAADTSVTFEASGTADTITLNGSTTGGIKGDFIEVIDIAADLFYVRAMLSGTGTEATPFSATV